VRPSEWKGEYRALRQGTENASARSRKSCGEVVRPLIKRPTRAMRLLRPGLYARVATLSAMVILLCAGAFLFLLPTGPDVPTAPTTSDSPIRPLWASGYGHPSDGSYLAFPLAEAEDKDGHPVNADLLTALLLLAVSFGATVGPLTNGRGRGAFRSVGIDRFRWFLSALGDRPSLGVLRL
jgi:hypothetical protein